MRLLFFIILFSFSVTTNASTIVVGKDQSLRSIKEAIGLAKNGDTIKVMPGIYREGTLTITKSITLLGINFPVLDGESKYENIVISGKNIKVAGFLIKDSRHSSSNDYAAISIIDATNITVENNQ